MKKLILSIAIATIATLGANAQVQFGINAGANMGNMVFKYDGKKQDGYKPAVGFIVSGDVNIPIGESMMFQTGLQFENAGSKYSEETTSSPYPGYTYKTKNSGNLKLNFINVPAKIYYKLPVGTGSLLIGAGPYVGIGISGKQKGSYVMESTFNGNTTRTEDNFDEKIKYGSADTTMKRMNFGAGVNVALQLASNIKISLYTNLGLANLSNEDKGSTKVTTFGLTVGYVFGGGKSEE